MIQLAIFPQYKDGYSYTATPIQNEHTSDGALFQSLPNDVSFQDTTSDTGSNAIDSDAPNGNWKRFNTGTGSGFGYVAPPNLFGQTRTQYGIPNQTGVVFQSNTAFNCHSGIYQKIYNLVPLRSYDLTINCTTTSANAGIFNIGVAGRTDTLGGGDIANFSTNAGSNTITFEAQSTEEVLIIQYNPFTNKNASIDSVSIKESLVIPTFNYSDIYDGQNILDLFQDDDIPLTLSVDEFKNATEKVQSYSKDFSLPATKNNNKVFFNLYDVTVSVKDKVKTFNPLMQTKAKLSEDGITFFEGFLKLSDISFVDDEPVYNVHLYSDVISLADTLKERSFSDLDLSELEHDYNSDNIEKSWDGELELINTLNGSSFAYDGVDLDRTPVLKYPFVDYTGSLDVTGNSFNLNRLEDAFRPFIQVKYLVNKIFDAAGFRYESNFMSQDKFTKLFMDFNYGEGNGASASVDRDINQEWQGGQRVYYTNSGFKNFYIDTALNPNNSDYYDTSNRRFTATTENQEVAYDVSLQFFNDDAFTTRNITTRALVTRTDGTTEVFDNMTTAISPNNNFWGSGGIELISFSNTITLNTGDILEFQGKGDTSQNDISQVTTGDVSIWQQLFNRVSFDVSSIGVDAESLLQSARGDIKQWEFIKSLFNMFNLITIPNPNDSKSFLIEPYNDIFVYNSDSKTHDWTMKENRGQHTIKSLELVKSSYFEYIRDEDDHTSNVYTNAIPHTNGRPYVYGSETFDASNLTILRGEQTIDTVIFAPTLMKPLKQGMNSMVVPTIFKSNEDKTEFNAYENAPRILYDNGKINGGFPYTSPAQNSAFQFTNKYSYLQFSHFSDFPTNNGSLDLNFKACPMIFGGYGMVRNLFNEYWSAYYDELYHVDTKIIKTELVLNANDLAAFRFYDKIMLKNREYRVNNIDYVPNGISKVELILIP
ncbi:hypothetical protein [uncultured Mediterranean phage uvDeep-CGR2-KM19-C269]|nr:hypothetical protein [uncultured Mediterranean phage uvDeep-CGR2-KM19-C269]